MDYGIDIISVLLAISICFLFYKLYYYLVITKYVKKINKAVSENKFTYANELLVYAMKKQPYKKAFKNSKVLLDEKNQKDDSLNTIVE
jgi:hypothetical protein